MNTKNYGLYAIALAIAVVGALWIGVPLGTLTFLVLVMACPLMMIFMMRGMHSGGGMHGGGHDQHKTSSKDEEPHDHKHYR
ncbi:DUF2933 domain-containing protein [Streptomyces sp. TRM66268-LWL]|uniref:DUF2933 domain-containing protein n=1 Tax=Streptomyces polyasparticus TaxID=2767826 RepID=A0ABR7SEJ3_9ACTN|nr:DUF2933 domain-containing protein [Streptomyces polyasparticus]MBC9713916.1 DUF2933 domain-containing protein [Streptomyces polyasparticus]